MSVLSDRDLRAALDAGEIGVEPFDDRDMQPASIDLHLDRAFRVFRNNRYGFIDPRVEQRRAHGHVRLQRGLRRVAGLRVHREGEQALGTLAGRRVSGQRRSLRRRCGRPARRW